MESTVTVSEFEDKVVHDFLTAWCPPTQWLRTVGDQNLNLKLILDYEEESGSSGKVTDGFDGEFTLEHHDSNVPDPLPHEVTLDGTNYGVRDKETEINVRDGVTDIPKDTFGLCVDLKSIILPDSLASIGGSAFIGCSPLQSIVPPPLITSVEEDTFSNCSSRESITMSSSVTYIGHHAFYGCSSLTSISIPDVALDNSDFGRDIMAVKTYNECEADDSEAEWVSSLHDDDKRFGDPFEGCTTLQAKVSGFKIKMPVKEYVRVTTTDQMSSRSISLIKVY